MRRLRGVTMFSKRADTSAAGADPAAELSAPPEEATPESAVPEGVGGTAASDVNGAAPSGPFDSRDYGDIGDLVDAGSLWLPLSQTALLQFGIDNVTHRVLAAFYITPQGAVQLQAYAAPRSHGIWDSLRRDLREALANAGGMSEEVESPFGTALLSQVSTGEDGGFVKQLFVGIDGPRWFLKATITGDAATDPALAQSLYEIIRAVVVHRGSEPHPPQEFLPLRLPAGKNPADVSA